MTDRPLLVTTVAHARAGLSGALRRFRADPDGAQPVVLGSHRRAEAVILPYARYEQIVLDLEAAGAVGRGAGGGADVGAGVGADAAASAGASGVTGIRGAAHGTSATFDAFDEVLLALLSNEERADQIDRWLSALDATLDTGADIVDRGRDVFRMDPALPLACETLATRLGELARLLIEADAARFEDPMWALAARTRTVFIRQYNKVDEQALWVLAAEGFPEIAELVATARAAH